MFADSEITLKILAHNNLIGRIIGKGGNTIKRIMQDTDSKITVSSINDINSFNLERIITVKGTIDNMSKAESMISSKLRQSYENDLQAMAVSLILYCLNIIYQFFKFFCKNIYENIKNLRFVWYADYKKLKSLK